MTTSGGPIEVGHLVGRDAELAVVENVLVRARTGACRTLLIRGDPGTGRSRLLDAVVARGSTLGFAHVVGRAQEHDRRVAYATLRLALHDRLADETSPRLADDARRGSTRCSSGGPCRDRRVRRSRSTSSTRSPRVGRTASRCSWRSTISTVPIPRRSRRSRSSLATSQDRACCSRRRSGRGRPSSLRTWPAPSTRSAGIELDDRRRPRRAAPTPISPR